MYYSKYCILPCIMCTFFAQFFEGKNKDVRYTWVVPEIPCVL